MAKTCLKYSFKGIARQQRPLLQLPYLVPFFPITPYCRSYLHTIAGLMMGRVLMWPVVISDSVNLHSFADPRHPPSIIPRQRGHCLHSASIYQSIRTALSLSRQGTNRGVKDCDYRIQCQNSNFPQWIQLYIFTALSGRNSRNNTAKSDPWTR